MIKPEVERADFVSLVEIIFREGKKKERKTKSSDLLDPIFRRFRLRHFTRNVSAIFEYYGIP